jgi:hypothetical protein
MALRCHELSALLALSSGRLAEADREASEGLHLAAVSGLAPFRTRLAVLALRAALASGSPRAAPLARAALQSAGAEDAWGRADALHWAGVALGREGERDAARAHLGEAATLRARLRHPELEATRAALATMTMAMD